MPTPRHLRRSRLRSQAPVLGAVLAAVGVTLGLVATSGPVVSSVTSPTAQVRAIDANLTKAKSVEGAELRAAAETAGPSSQIVSLTATAVPRGSPGALLGWFDGTQTQADVQSAGSHLGVAFDAITVYEGGSTYCSPYAPSATYTVVVAMGICTSAQASAIGAALVAAGDSTAIIRPGWEMNGNWYPWSSLSPATFISEFQADVTALRGVAGNHFSILWDVNGLNQDNGAWNDTYPGDSWVDAVGIDQYDFSGYQGNTATVQAFAVAHSKQFMVPEWGLNGSDDPAFINYYAGLTGVSELGYFSWAGGINSLLSSFKNSQAQFIADFGGSPPPTTTTVPVTTSTTHPTTTTSTSTTTTSTTSTTVPVTTTTTQPSLNCTVTITSNVVSGTCH